MNLRTLLTRLLIGLVTFGATTGIAWAITHDGSDDPDAASAPASRPVAPLASELAETWISSELPGGEDPGARTTSSTPEADGPGEDGASSNLAVASRFPLAGAIASSPAEALREVPAVAWISDEAEGSPDPDGTAASTTAVESTPTTSVSDHSVDTIVRTTIPPAETPSLGRPVALRFIDPCADLPSACADLVGRAAIGGTIRTLSDPPPPVEIRGISVSGGTSDGCAGASVLDGTRAVGVDLNRPAELRFSWWRAGATVGEETVRGLTDSDREAFADRPGRGWSTCVEVPFPTATEATAAFLHVTATADDHTTASHTQNVFDDDGRRLLIAIIDDDEIVAMTPDVGAITLAGIKLGDDEPETAGCRRAAAQVLTDSPAPGTATDAFEGRRVPAELARQIMPSDGEWVAGRFTDLEESQRYAICLFSIGRNRGDTGGAIQATDAVLVQAPDRERYRMRPMTLIGPGSIDGRRVGIDVGAACRFGWGVAATTRTSAEQDLTGSTWCELGALPTPETITARVAVEGLPTSEATFSLPAHCAGPATCDPIGAPRFVRLDVAGPRYTRRLCGTGIGGGCDGGLRPRDEIIGTVIMLIERLGGPAGYEGFSVGGSRRFSAEIPEDYWELVDYSASGLELGRRGTITARLKTSVPSNATITVRDCFENARVYGLMTSAGPTIDHEFTITEALGPGECASMAVVAVDPTGERAAEVSDWFRGVHRDHAEAELSVQMEVVSLQDDHFPIHGLFNVSVGGAPDGPDRLWECISAPATVATVNGSMGRSWLLERTRLAFRVDFLGGCDDRDTPFPEDRVVEADVAFDALIAGPVVIEHVQPDGVHLRFRVTASNIFIPR